jgi:hypothetical protein
MTDLAIYANYSSDVVRGFESWLGRSVDGVIVYADKRSWDQMVYSPLWMAQQDVTIGGTKPLHWAVPLTTDGTKLEDVADGGYEGYFHLLAERMASIQPAGDITVRIGWEHNGWWYPWSSIGREADYIQAYRMAVDQFRQVSDRFVFEWNFNEAYHENPAPAYPGDDVVDIISIDGFYNTEWSGWDGVRAFELVRDKPYGLAWLESFAAAHDKPTAYSEWGVTADTQGADYIRLFAAWVKEHAAAADGEGVVYTGYWESNDHLPAYLQDNTYPAASEAFRAAFGPIVVRQPAQLAYGSGPDVLVLRVNQDAWQGDARYAVYVDDARVGPDFTASALHASGQSDTLTLKGAWGAGPHQVRVDFLNDAWGGTATTDRNLYVPSSSYNGVEGPGVSGWNGGSFVFGTAGAPAPQPVSLSAGTGPDTLVLRVSQDAWLGDAQYAVFVDGARIGGTFTAAAWHSTGQTDTLTLRGDWTDGPHQVRVDFLNDAWGGTPETDRNLYVPAASYNGVASAALGDGWTGGSFWVG